MTTVNTVEQLVDQHSDAAAETIKATFTSHHQGNASIIASVAKTAGDIVKKYTLPALQEAVETFSTEAKKYDDRHGS